MTKIRYGTSAIEREFDSPVTIDDLLEDRAILSALNAPSDVKAFSAGEELDGNDYVASYDEIALEKSGSKKG